MSNLQAFILICCVLLIETITLIVFGFNYGKEYAFPTFMLFLLVDSAMCTLACVLKVIKEE